MARRRRKADDRDVASPSSSPSTWFMSRGNAWHRRGPCFCFLTVVNAHTQTHTRARTHEFTLLACLSVQLSTVNRMPCTVLHSRPLEVFRLALLKPICTHGTTPCCPLPAARGNHHSTFRFYEFNYFRYLPQVAFCGWFTQHVLQFYTVVMHARISFLFKA